MKDSGIEWLGEIPQGWVIQKTKFLFEVVNGATPRSGNSDYWEGCIPWMTPADFITARKYITEPRRYITEKGLNSCGTRLVPKGSIIVSTRAPIGSIAMAEFQLCTNQGCKSLIKKEEVYPDYYYYFLSVMDSALNALGEGTTFAELSSSNFGNFYLPVPTIKEQQDISNYLDSVCAQIDKVITSKQNSNELLKEHRQSIIYEAVTKGLGRNALMKDSGIEWIGMIPLEWGLEKLKFSAEINPRADIALKDEDDVSFVPMDNLKFGFHTTTLVPYERVKKGYVPFSEGDILIAKVTPCFENGNLAIASNLRDGVGFGSTEITVIRAENIHVRYLYYYFQNPKFIERGTYDMYGVAGLKRLPTSFFANTCIPTPTLWEQKTISDYLDDKCGEIDRLIRANNLTIEKLIEYRQGIIFEAVTGKMEVPRNCGGR
jgi:type I restriction enzyme S subunit